MHKSHRITFIAAVAALFLSTTAFAAEEPAKKEETAEAVIVGNPPADSPFGKLKIGMSYEEVIAIVGKPTNQHDFCTGKHRIPFYFGDDRARTEAFFKGMGKLDFYGADGGFWGKCGMQKILGLVYIEYDPKATGELPK
ncbi:MAG: hypothetical protein KA435_10420 [Azonexus sp.]|nr:hypothetical protein [Azonexus sp.]MBP6203452.1 hypothetical protein [Azonexus sp.]